MYEISREVQFCYGHRLHRYKGKCHRFHGHNARVVVTLASEILDEQGMVLDFHQLSLLLKNWIDENFDHRLLLHQEDPLVTIFQQAGEDVVVLDVEPTAENLARMIGEFAISQELPLQKVEFWESAKSCAVFRP